MPSPAASPMTGRAQGSQRLPNAARATTAASQARTGTPRSQQNSNGTQSKGTKVDGNVNGSSIGRSSHTKGRRESVANVWNREKPPSKDGTVQRSAKEVAGLKEFVRHTFFSQPTSVLVMGLEIRKLLSHDRLAPDLKSSVVEASYRLR